jgi:AraC family transcriptional regulator
LGKIAVNVLARGDGWSVADVVCTSGPQDRPFEERHGAVSIAVVVEGTFQYRSVNGSELMSPGSLLLGNHGQSFECRHEHGIGDRCVAFQYTPEFFDRAGIPASFPVHRIPPVAELAPWIVEARLGTHSLENVSFEELAHGLAGTALDLAANGAGCTQSSAADERRISAALRFIEANLSEPLPLSQLAANAQMSDFHFLRVFKRVTRLTPHQYILRARLRQAALALKSRAVAVIQIALDAGFQDLSNFHHAFRAEFGMSPARFRLSAKSR